MVYIFLVENLLFLPPLAGSRSGEPRGSAGASGRLLFLPENGVALQVRRASLCVRDATGEEALYPPRVHGFRTIILGGRGRSITDESIRWASRENVALYLMCKSGEAFAVIGEAVGVDHRRAALAIRARQFRTALDSGKRMVVARKIVGAKRATLALHPADIAIFRAEIAYARSILELMASEACAGSAYFMRFRGCELKFSRDADVPAHWRAFVVRASAPLKGSTGVSMASNAATPIGAMLNYSYAVALGQCARAIVGAGLDPSFGFLHSPRQGRLSLTAAFKQSAVGVVTLGPAVAKDMAALALRVASIATCGKSVRRIVAWL
jgi:CRISP-associated protein Cas1